MGICITYNYHPKENNDIKVAKIETEKEQMLKKRFYSKRGKTFIKLRSNNKKIESTNPSTMSTELFLRTKSLFRFNNTQGVNNGQPIINMNIINNTNQKNIKNKSSFSKGNKNTEKKEKNKFKNNEKKNKLNNIQLLKSKTELVKDKDKKKEESNQIKEEEEYEEEESDDEREPKYELIEEQPEMNKFTIDDDNHLISLLKNHFLFDKLSEKNIKE